MRDYIEDIRHGLLQLREATPQPRVFGAEAHEFILHPPLNEAVVRKFENKHRIQLPADYRRFLIELGNGGAGPFYGVFKLGEMDNNYDHKKWKESDGFIGVLAKPFPHVAAWNELPAQPEESEDEEEYERLLNIFDDIYWNTDNVNGAIPLCHEGCATRDWLVVTGSEAGNMWHDARADQKGLRPIVKSGKKRVTFIEWYMYWLKEALSMLRKSSK
jgi:hypothetical protein